MSHRDASIASVVSRVYAKNYREKKRRFREDNNAETVGAKCYFLSLAFLFQKLRA